LQYPVVFSRANDDNGNGVQCIDRTGPENGSRKIQPFSYELADHYLSRERSAAMSSCASTVRVIIY